MLSIERKPKHTSCFNWWIHNWFQMLNASIGICSFEFLIGFEKNNPLPFGERIGWWFHDWIMILESLFVILTFGFLWPDWSYRSLTRIINNHYNPEKR